MRLRAVLLALLLPAVAACNFEDPHPWPVPELSLPSSAMPARLPADFTASGLKVSEDGSALDPSNFLIGWMRGFDYAQGWDSLVRHVEGQIVPIGFTSVDVSTLASIPPDSGPWKRDRFAKAWVSPADDYYVTLLNFTLPQLQSEADYILGIEFTPAEAKRRGIEMVEL